MLYQPERNPLLPFAPNGDYRQMFFKKLKCYGKFFYRDGYGKEYSILNLAEDRYEEH
ncbi:MAG: hypothetical protein MRJ65_01270 [Candidatus Brocadiaceae bacterium]|nr:hypothetical protein [Candidatus Brocadiaceae bacterium]